MSGPNGAGSGPASPEVRGAAMPEWLGRRAALTPDRPALEFAGRRWTFAHLDAMAADTARRLAGLGVGAGDRVAALLQNGPAFVGLVHAVARLGAVLVPLSTRLTPAELAWQLEDSGARLLLYDAVNAGSARAAATGISARAGRRGLARVLVGSRAPGKGAEEAAAGGVGEAAAGEAVWLDAVPPAQASLRHRVRLSDPHTIIYTAGTTGRPKGAVLSYENHWWSAVGSALNLGLLPEDRWLLCLPLFHVGGLSILFRGVIYGNCAVVHPRFDPAATNRALDEDGVTLVSLVAAMLAQVLEARGQRPAPPELRAVLLGGGPAPRALLEASRARGIPVLLTYGLTETASQVATQTLEDAVKRPGSAGKPLFATEVRVARDGRPAPAGEAGEIQVRGPTVTAGYVNLPPGAGGPAQDGWLATGDVGYLDREGYLYVLDRRDDLIVSGGENVYPAEVEAVLLSHPAVLDAGVVGMPDPRWGAVPVAWVCPRPGAAVSEVELVAHGRSHLAGYKVPARVRFTGELPRNAAGKLLRRVLRERWQAEAGAPVPGGGHPGPAGRGPWRA